MSEKPDTISVTVSGEAELDATAADLDLMVEGSSIFTGHEAFKKARELRELFELLTAAGLKAEQLCIQGLRLGSDGLLGWKGSSCTYSVRVRKVSCEILPQALGTLAGKKGVTMARLHWRFDSLENEVARLRGEAMASLLAKARQTAELLRVDLLGIYSLREKVDLPEAPQAETMAGGWSAAKTHRVAAGPPLGVAFNSRSAAILTIEADFRVSTFRP